MYEKKSVHFGGGNIGRGFVAKFLHDAGYEVVFVDVMDSVIEALQKTPSYTVTEIAEDSSESKSTIDHYRAINSKYEEQKVVDEIATADTVTCAVGPNILKFIAPVIAKGIEARKLDYPLAVIACENAIGATDTLAKFIKEKLSEETLKNLDAKTRFANSAVDRIVPQQDPDAGLDVKIEKFYEWCVESAAFEKGGGKRPDISAVHYVDDLTPYIERKLFTVNTSHATAAYYGYHKGIKFIHEAMADAEVERTVKEAVSETAKLITDKHAIDAQEQQGYVDTIIRRISNPLLKDDVVRVGRAPLRKLSRKERFVGPAAELAEMDEKTDALLRAMEMAFRFQDVEGDEESAELGKIVKENEPKGVVQKVCGLDEGHPLFEKVVKVVTKVKGDGK